MGSIESYKIRRTFNINQHSVYNITSYCKQWVEHIHRHNGSHG